MSNVFLQNQDYAPAVKRNPYDLGRLNNSTFRSGIIYPIGWDDVTFGDSIRLRISAGLRTLPMLWPLQTPIIAKFYTFYVRLRTLQKNFTDFRFGNKPIVHPYIAFPSDSPFWKTCGLGDYLGIPTTYASDRRLKSLLVGYPSWLEGWPSPRDSFPVFWRKSLSTPVSFSNDYFSPVKEDSFLFPCRMIANFISKSILDSSILIRKDYLVDNPAGHLDFFLVKKVSLSDQPLQFAVVGYETYSPVLGVDGFYRFSLNSGIFYSGTSTYNGGFKGYFNSIPSSESYTNKDYFIFVSPDSTTPGVDVLTTDAIPFSERDRFAYYDLGEGITELSDVSNPFSGNNPVIPLSSLPVRAYEACYRSHFQDLINEPFIIDGEPQYNRYITNDGDGADFDEIPLFHRNWEADRFTSCKPSPQQGMAPIVGMTSDGNIVLQRSDGTDIEYHVTFDKDGVADGFVERVAGQAAGDTTVKRRLLDLATTGFTINSLRDVNSYQRWKEAVYRKSPKFKDQVRSVFGVNLEYKELDMPEFLGGFDIMLNVSEITQTSSSVEGSPLGDLAGRGVFAGRAKHEISHFCDEEGIVMTLMCITPIPVYSQMLDRKWLKSTPLDYYNPQFGKIGNQAITYEEVCPVQAYNEGIDVHDVFGYQRPWYHYISSFDEVHGLFRNQMNGFVWQRIFGSTPELGKDFLHIDESQLNDVFVAGQGQDDTFYGQINYDCDIKRGIPRQIVSSLE